MLDIARRGQHIFAEEEETNGESVTGNVETQHCQHDGNKEKNTETRGTADKTDRRADNTERAVLNTVERERMIL